MFAGSLQAREATARRFSLALARLIAASLLLEQAAWSAAAGEPAAVLWCAAADRWSRRLSVPPLPASAELLAGETLARG
jgi:hypothetical protein